MALKIVCLLLLLLLLGVVQGQRRPQPQPPVRHQPGRFHGHQPGRHQAVLLPHRHRPRPPRQPQEAPPPPPPGAAGTSAVTPNQPTVVLVSGAAPPPPPFCPLEKNGNRCKSRKNQFKCGVFFVDLDGQSEKLRWIGALPDVLSKPSVKNSPSLLMSVGNLKRRNFRVNPKVCSNRLANARCYAIMEKLSRLPLDSCAPSILNDSGDATVGDVLCRKAALFVPGQHFQSFVNIGFYHSACGDDWRETRLGSQPLRFEEELCCKYNADGRQAQFFRCDGTAFKRSCSSSIFG